MSFGGIDNRGSRISHTAIELSPLDRFWAGLPEIGQGFADDRMSFADYKSYLLIEKVRMTFVETSKDLSYSCLVSQQQSDGDVGY